MSETMRHFVGGQQKLMPELLAMVAPTINSYTRLIPGFWAPTDSTCGVENRTCALRIIPGQREVAARRVSGRGRGRQSLRHPGRRARLRAVGHREQRSSPSRWSTAMPTTTNSPNAWRCRARCGMRRSA